MSTTNITAQDIHAILEIAMDKELPAFDMSADWYETYEMDSLSAIALSVEVQKKYSVDLVEDRLKDIRTGEQLLVALNELLSAKVAA
jgi:acyl carrier protein